jgi:hypothetical protein
VRCLERSSVELSLRHAEMDTLPAATDLSDTLHKKANRSSPISISLLLGGHRNGLNSFPSTGQEYRFAIHSFQGKMYFLNGKHVTVYDSYIRAFRIESNNAVHTKRQGSYRAAVGPKITLVSRWNCRVAALLLRPRERPQEYRGLEQPAILFQVLHQSLL